MELLCISCISASGVLYHAPAQVPAATSKVNANDEISIPILVVDGFGPDV
jgi:hypothetical protein